MAPLVFAFDDIADGLSHDPQEGSQDQGGGADFRNRSTQNEFALLEDMGRRATLKATSAFCSTIGIGLPRAEILLMDPTMFWMMMAPVPSTARPASKPWDRT